jgi:hypothetical protein
VSGANNGVACPIAEMALTHHDGWALTDIDSIGDEATTGVLTAPLVVASAAPSQAPPQSAALMFVLPDHLIDAFMAYGGVVFFLEPTADLFRAPSLLLQLRGDQAVQSLGQLPRLTSNALLPVVRFTLCLLEPMAASAAVPAQFPPDGASVETKAGRYVFLLHSALDQGM